MSFRYNLRKFGSPTETMPAPENNQASTSAGSANEVIQDASAVPPGFSPLPRYNVHVEQYSGKGDPTQWWTMFMAYITLQRIPSAEAIIMLPFYLTGVAREWFNLLQDSSKTSLATVKEHFEKRFKPAVRQGSKLVELQQRDHETTDDFIHRALALNIDNAVSEDFLLSIVEKGFRKELAQIIIPQRPKTMEQMREIAAVAEKTLQVTSNSNSDISLTINQAVQSAISSCERNLLNSLMARMDSTLSAVTRPTPEQHRVKFTPRRQNTSVPNLGNPMPVLTKTC